LEYFFSDRQTRKTTKKTSFWKGRTYITRVTNNVDVPISSHWEKELYPPLVKENNKEAKTTLHYSMLCVSIFFLLVTVVRQVGGSNSNSNISPNDVYYTAFDSASWAVTSNELSPMLGMDKQVLYDTFIDDCNFAIFKGNLTDMQVNNGRECASQDKYRQRMNRDQPMSVHNFTKKGYQKIKAPAPLMELILEFWNKNKEKAITEWKDVNVYHNTWDSPVRCDWDVC
jgi:hypothetical protein